MDYRDTLDEIELKGGLVGGRDRAVRFMIEACRKMSLSDDLKESLDVAGRHLTNEVSDDALTAARVMCWQSIEGRDSDLSDARVAATRAVICTLYPSGKDDDLFDTFGCVRGFCGGCGAFVRGSPRQPSSSIPGSGRTRHCSLKDVMEVISLAGW